MEDKEKGKEQLEKEIGSVEKKDEKIVEKPSSVRVKKEKEIFDVENYVPRFRTFYEKEMVPVLKKTWNIQNDYAVPKITSIVVSTTLGKHFKDNGIMEMVEKDISLITGRQPAFVLAKKSVAAFQLRQGVKLGYKVTLRGNMMFEFLDRFINIALTQSRNFFGFHTKSFDGRGNISIGISDYSIFPEISYRKMAIGLSITICTNTWDNAENSLRCIKKNGNNINLDVQKKMENKTIKY